MADKPKARINQTVLAYALFLVGLAFLIESIVFVFVLSQLPAQFIGTTAVVAWLYAVVKFFAGLIAMYAGIDALQKK